MGFCPADCSDVTIDNSQAPCELQPRKRGIERFGFYTCDTDLPSPLTCSGLLALVNSGKLAFSNPVANVNVNETNYADIILSDCQPAIEVPTNRVVQFRDNIAVDLAATTSPMSDPIPNYNQKFWGDKLNKQLSLRALVVMCDGSVYIPKDDNDVPLPFSMRASLAYDNVGNAQSPLFIEYVQCQLDFKGDPLNPKNPPQEDGNGVVFDISTCTGLY